MDAGYERQARQLQDELKGLTEERESWRRTAERAESTLGGTPRLRDRNKFFNWLLNGELAVLERVAPLWQEVQRCAREVDRVERLLAVKKAELDTAVHWGLAEDDTGYQTLLVKADRERAVKRSCKQLLDAIRAARKRIDQASRRPRDEASRSQVDLDVSEVASRIRAVRRHAADVDQKISSHHSFGSKHALKLDSTFPVGKGDYKARLRKYKEAKASLASLEGSVNSLLRDVAARENAVEDQRQRYVAKERARFDDAEG